MRETDQPDDAARTYELSQEGLGIEDELAAELRAEGLEEFKDSENYCDSFFEVNIEDTGEAGDNSDKEEEDQSSEREQEDDDSESENQSSHETQNNESEKYDEINSGLDSDAWAKQIESEDAEQHTPESSDIHRIDDQSHRPEMERGRNRGIER